MNLDPNSLIHWSDDHIVVVEKPPGLRSVPDGYDPSLPHLRSVLEPKLGRLWIVHRLDKLTSGLMVLARSATAHRDLNLQFDRSIVEKTYHAVVQGVPSWITMLVDLPLLTDGDRRHRTIIDHQSGKPAQTEFSVLEHTLNRALVEAKPLTGRTHQIRAHLAAIGHAIIGDPLYGNQRPDSSPGRLALHAAQLGFSHPVTQASLKFEVGDPAEFQRMLQQPDDT